MRRATRAGSPSIVGRSGCGPLNAALSGADLDRGEDPGQMSRKLRRLTMRHWITSFRLVDNEMNVERA